MARSPPATATESSGLSPLPRTPHKAPRNLPNAGNTCYISSILVAVFADMDAQDALLTASSNQESLVSIMRKLVTNLRDATAASRTAISSMRAALVARGWHSGTGQHDAAELFAFLFDALCAPYLPLVRHLSHSAAPDTADVAPFTERLLWLPLRSHLVDMLDAYFRAGRLHGLRRGGRVVSAAVTRRLFPFYTPLRETGERVDARRAAFNALVIPLAISRFRPQGDGKDRSPVHVPTAIPAAAYIHPLPSAPAYTLILRSVVCHLGPSLHSGHYVAYTYSPVVGWRRWDDLSSRPVSSVRSSVLSGAPENSTWANEIARDSYLLFYELVPGDTDLPAAAAKQLREDEGLAKHMQIEEDFRAAFREQMRHAAHISDPFFGFSPVSDSSTIPNVDDVPLVLPPDSDPSHTDNHGDGSPPSPSTSRSSPRRRMR